MLKTCRNFGVLALTLIALSVIAWELSAVATCERERREEAAESKNANQEAESGSQICLAKGPVSASARLFHFTVKHGEAIGAGITVAATAAIAFFTFTLWRATNRLWDAGERQYGLSKRSVDTVAALESPLVIVTAIALDPRQWGTGDTWINLPAVECGIKIIYENFGRSPAIILAVCLEWKVCPQLPAEAIYSNIEQMDSGTVIRPNDKGRFDRGRRFDIEFSQEEIFAERRDDTHLWVYGFVRYRGSIGPIQEMRFCARWVRGDIRGSPYRFVEDGPEKYRNQNQNAGLSQPS
jgi:hypothetical protein